MTREQKLALVLGFAAVLVVGLLISDHLAAARSADLDDVPHDGTVVVDATEGEALRRVVTLPRTEEEFRGRPARRIAESRRPAPAPTSRVQDRVLADTTVAAESGQASQPSESFEQEPIRLVVSPRGGVYDPGEMPQGRSVLDVVSESVAGGAEAVAGGVRKLADIAQITRPGGMAAVGERGKLRDSREVPTRPVFVQHHVQANESLYKIAARYYGDGNQWRRIAEANPGRVGENGSVREGVTLRIMDPKTGGTPNHTASRSPVKLALDDRSTARASKGPLTYTVKSGDTLGEISQELLGTVRRQHELIALNRDVLKDPDNLLAGTVL
ncbi:MAG: LysM peptidoglycan-binding domain-containing protein, partial [Phycisphaerales bacterium JB060]